MSAMDLDRITRRFAEAYESAHEALTSGLGGPNDSERRLRASQALGECIFACFTGGPPPAELLRRLTRAARRRVLEFACAWEWRLADGPPAQAREITPDVLGLVLEQRVNQRQTGSYYTRSDVSRYIAAATIVPALLDALAMRTADGESIVDSMRRRLAADPLRYVPSALAGGAVHPEGTRAPAELPGETPDEAAQRRNRCRELVQNLQSGRLGSVDDLVTWNVDLVRLTCDLIAKTGDPQLAEAVWQVLTGRTDRQAGRVDSVAFRVLDPTCGSGAFLVAALDVLEPLYRACAAKLSSGVNGGRHAAWIRRMIVERNLYGVDLLPEAAGMCRLRLRLKVAAAEPGRSAAGRSLAPPRDNIQIGDALAGDLRRVPSRNGHANGAFDWQRAFPRVLAHGGFNVVIGNPPYIEVAGTRANGNRAAAYGSFQLAPTGNLFALCTERSLELLRAGGRLGVILPMSVASTPRMRPLMELLESELSRVWLSHFACRPGKLFVGVDMNVTIVLGHRRTEFHSVRLTAHSRLTAGNDGTRPQTEIHTTGYQRWPKPYRPFLFETLHYTPTALLPERGTIPKLRSACERRLLGKLLHLAADGRLRAGAEHAGDTSAETVYVHSGGRYFRKCLRQRLSNEYKPVHVPAGWGDAAVCLLSSSLFYWLWITLSDCYHVTDRDLQYLPFVESLAADPALPRLARRLSNELWANSRTRSRRRADGSTQQEVNFDVSRSKLLLDEIDRALALHFGLTAAELEFILEFDGRYRIPALGDALPARSGRAELVQSRT